MKKRGPIHRLFRIENGIRHPRYQRRSHELTIRRSEPIYEGFKAIRRCPKLGEADTGPPLGNIESGPFERPHSAFVRTIRN